MSASAAALVPRLRPAPAWHSSRALRLEVTLGVLRLLLAGLTVTSVTGMALEPSAAVPVHLGVAVATLGSLLVLPAAWRAGREGQLGLALTVATLAFYVVYTLAVHEVHGAGTALGLLALLEAPVRYGPRGMLLSVPPVLGIALTHPQQDASGYAPSAGTALMMSVALLTATLLLREASLRSAAATLSGQERLAEAMLHLPLGIALADPDGRVLQANPALAALLGASDPATLLGRPLCEQLPAPHPEHRARRPPSLQPGIGGCSGEYATADGRWLSVGSAPVRLSGAGPRGWVFHVEDVTARRREREDLVHEARHDALTGLLSRAAGSQALSEALRSHPHTAVLFLDLDGFKQLNDTAGHAVGDAVLRRAAARVRGTLRTTEAAVRWGGDEIVVICRDVHDDEVLHAVAERLLEAMRAPFSVSGVGTLTVTVSIGGVRTEPGARLDEVVHAADGAMYRAKRAGGDRCALAPAVAQAAPPAPRLHLDGEPSPVPPD